LWRAGDPFRHHEDGEKSSREQQAGNRSGLFGEQVDDRRGEQRDRDQRDADRQLTAADPDVQRHLPAALDVRPLVAQHEHRQRVEREAPHDAERVRFAEQNHVAAADHDRHDLQDRDHVDQPVGGPEAPVRLAEPLGQHAVLGNPVQHAVRSDDRGVDRARQHQEADDHDDGLEHQAQRQPVRPRAWQGRRSGCRNTAAAPSPG